MGGRDGRTDGQPADAGCVGGWTQEFLHNLGGILQVRDWVCSDFYKIMFLPLCQTRVLVTHGISFLPQVDQIVVLQDGRISEVGNSKHVHVTLVDK